MLTDRFRSAVETGDVTGVSELFREDAVFRSPVVYRPYVGREAVLKVLEAAERVLNLGGHFRYIHQLEDRDAGVAILEFATEVDGRQVEGIDKLNSASRDENSSLNIEFTPDRNLESAANDVRDRVSRVMQKLPPESDAPQIGKQSDNADAVMIIILNSATRNPLEVTDYAYRYLVDRFAAVPGVATVNLNGARIFQLGAKVIF